MIEYYLNNFSPFPPSDHGDFPQWLWNSHQECWRLFASSYEQEVRTNPLQMSNWSMSTHYITAKKIMRLNIVNHEVKKKTADVTWGKHYF